MWCPSVSLSVWANAWLAGLAAPDDVLDALSRWSPTQSVTAYDSVTAGRTGLPWADGRPVVSLLQTLRAAANRPAGIGVVFPVPGDVRGLPAGTPFARDALTAGEAVTVADSGNPGSGMGLVPELRESDELSWTVYTLPGLPPPDDHDLGEAEYALRTAVRSATDTLATLCPAARDPDLAGPHELVEEIMESVAQHRIPDHAPARALRVLQTAGHVDAILLASVELGSPSTTALDPLAALVRSARIAAVNAILRSAWRR